MSALTLAQSRAETVRAPRWRNWWRVLAPITLFVRGREVGQRNPGDYEGQTSHASKELAEQVAVNAARNNPVHYARLEYLGAYREGERPNGPPDAIGE